METVTIALPLGGNATMRGMRGVDEDLLSNQKKAESGEAVNEILANCTVDLRGSATVSADTIKGLRSPDRLAMLLAIRQASYGDTVEAELQCADESCRHKFSVDVDLSVITSTPLPESYVEDTGFTVTLPSGDIVTFDYLTGTAEGKLAKASKDEMLTSLMLSRLVKVEGVHQNSLKKWLREAPVSTRRALREALEKVECGPNVLLKADCPECGVENEFQVHGVRGFFYPR